jgi:hypothetical protein
MGLTFGLAVISARQVLGGVLYFMARNTASARPTQATSTPSTPQS